MRVWLFGLSTKSLYELALKAFQDLLRVDMGLNTLMMMSSYSDMTPAVARPMRSKSMLLLCYMGNLLRNKNHVQ